MKTFIIFLLLILSFMCYDMYTKDQLNRYDNCYKNANLAYQAV